MKVSRTLTLKEAADKIGAQVIPLSSAEETVTGFTTLERAQENDLSFITSSKFHKQAEESHAKTIVSPLDLRIKGKTLLQVENVWKAVLILLGIFYPESEPSGRIHEKAVIHPEAVLGENVTVGPGAVIDRGAHIGDHSVIGALCYVGEDAKTGHHCLLHPHAIVMKECEIGNRVILQPGAVIGSDGFKYELIDGVPTKIPQKGRVILEDDVEIGANTCVDRASFTETRIGRGTKLDNLIQIAHNVEIGPWCLMAAQVGIAGSTKIGTGCIFGGQAGIRDNIVIGDHVMIAAKAGIPKNVPDHAKMFGYVAMPAEEGMRREIMINRLPKMYETLKQLQERLKALEDKSASKD